MLLKGRVEEFFHASAMLTAARHPTDVGFLRFRCDPLVLPSKGSKRSVFHALRADPFTTSSFTVCRKRGAVCLHDLTDAARCNLDMHGE